MPKRSETGIRSPEQKRCVDAADATHRSLFTGSHLVFVFFPNPNFYAAYNPKGAADIPRRCFLLKCSHNHPAHTSAAPFATVASGPPPRTVFCLIWGCPQWAQHALFSLHSLSRFDELPSLFSFARFSIVRCLLRSRIAAAPALALTPSYLLACLRIKIFLLFSSLLTTSVLSPRLHHDDTTSRSNHNRTKKHEKPPPPTRPRPLLFLSFLRRSLVTAR